MEFVNVMVNGSQVESYRESLLVVAGDAYCKSLDLNQDVRIVEIHKNAVERIYDYSDQKISRMFVEKVFAEFYLNHPEYSENYVKE